MRRIREEVPTSGGGAWSLRIAKSANSASGKPKVMLTGLGAISVCGAIFRTVLAKILGTSVRTTVLQHDISMRPHSPAIFSQQSISSCVRCRSGRRQTIWGASPQTMTTVTTAMRNNRDMRRVYTAAFKVFSVQMS